MTDEFVTGQTITFAMKVPASGPISEHRIVAQMGPFSVDGGSLEECLFLLRQEVRKQRADRGRQ